MARHEHPEQTDPSADGPSPVDPGTTGTDADRPVPAADQQAQDPQTTADDDQPVLVLTTVALPYGNRLTTYDAAGNGIIWQVPAELSARVATGGMPRREAGEGYSTQCVVVDQTTNTLRGVENDSWPGEMVDENSLPVPPAEFQARLQQLLVSAARRGESVVFAGAGQLEMQPPCVRATALLDEDEQTWLSVIEAFPPFLEGPWADAEVEDDQSCSVKTALLETDALGGGAVLMLVAAQSFTPGPDQIGLYFEQAPDGPWPG